MNSAMALLQRILDSSPKEFPSINTSYTIEDFATSHSIGDFYIVDDILMLLAQVSSGRCCLIGISSANRWNEGALVEDIYNLTQNEWNAIAPVDKCSIRKINRRD